MSKTAAQQQIELLKRMKAGRLEPLAPEKAPMQKAPRARKAAPQRGGRAHSLPLARETWELLIRRQASTREFRGKKDMGEWAARLLLALPAGAHSLDAKAIEDLFACMRAFCAERGLR